MKVAKDRPDDFVKNAAELAVRYMQDIKDARESMMYYLT